MRQPSHPPLPHLPLRHHLLIIAVVLIAPGAALSQNLILVRTSPAVVYPGDSVTIEVQMDFTSEPTLGGGFDITFDPARLTYVSFVDNGLGDPGFSQPPTISSGLLEGWAFGSFSGLSGPAVVGTVTFQATGTGGIASIDVQENTGSAGPFVSAFTLTTYSPPLVLDGASVTITLVCANGLDDDGDGFTDLQDPGCADATDPSEVHIRPGDVLASRVDGGIALFDPETTRMSPLGDSSFFTTTWDVHVGPEGRILATDSSADQLLEVDVETGLATVISSGGSFVTPRGVVASGPNSAFVSDSGIDEILEVDLLTGTQTLVTNGAPFSQPQNLLLRPSDGALISSDFGAVDIITDPLGTPSISSIFPTSFTSLQQIAFDGPTSVIVGDSSSDIPYRLDLVTAVETPLLSFVAFDNLLGAAKEESGLYLFGDFGDFGDGKIVRVSEAANTATVLDPGSQGQIRNLATVPGEIDLTLELTDTIVVDGGDPNVVDIGDTLELTAVVTNVGATTADLLSVGSGLDPSLTLVASSLTTTQGAIVEGSLGSDPRVEVDLGSLAPAATATVRWRVDVADPAPARSVSANAWVRREKIILAESDDPTTGPANDPNVIGVGDYGVIVQAVRKVSDTRGELSGPGNPGSVLSTTGLFGGSLEPLGDIDGDGIEDLAVGAYENDDDAGVSYGAFYILLMNADSTVKQRFKWNALSPDLAAALATAGLSLANDQFGSGIAYLGDLDGAGPADFALAVGAWYDDGLSGTDRGAVYILFMDQSPLQVLSVSKIGDGVGGFPSGQLSDFDYFGNDVEAAGDIDGDGVIDLAVGAHLDDTIGTNSGGVWILFLNQNGTVKASPPVQILVSPSSTGDFVGLGIASLGLFDGDAVPDLAVSATRRDVGGPDRGAVWILTLNANGTVKTQTEISPGVGGLPAGLLENDDRFGRGLEVLPDLDGDGTVELVVGANRDADAGFRAGAVYALFLTPSGTTDKVVQLAPQPGVLFAELNDNDRFGLSIAPIGDLDGDGDLEVAVAAPLDNDGTSDAGGVYILSTATPLPEPRSALGLVSGFLFVALLNRRRSLR